MHIKQKDPFSNGYNAITELDGKHSDMLMDFGILKLQPADEFNSNEDKERAFLLIQGEVIFKWNEQEQKAQRKSIFEEKPF
ncbi:MAG: 5-deoxy-glucuronate isomerase, partial [Spirochaetes bacterium]|nr:5-deoxy-glucuronate isomerase [Spirochaetota bacterium]